MKIHGSTQYVDPLKNENWYSLEVINQWDWITKAVCFQIFGNYGTISYCLKYNTSLGENRYNSEVITELTPEMEAELVSMGYILRQK